MGNCALCNRPIRPGEVFNRYEVEGMFPWPGELCHKECYEARLRHAGGS